MNDATASLAEIDRQRAALADRVHLPLWYRTLWAFALLALFAVPLLQGVWPSNVVVWAVQTPAIVVLIGSDWVLHRYTGARLSRRTMRAYPSSRMPGLGMIGTILVGVVAEWVLIRHGLAPFAWIVALLAVTLTARLFERHLAGIRADIRAGTAVPA